MKIAIIGANGRLGQLLVDEATDRGHDVLAIVREKKKDFKGNVEVLEKDLFDLTYDDLKDYGVIISAFGVWVPEQMEQHQTSLSHLADTLSGKNNRLLVAGGAGSLYVDKGHTQRLMDSPDFPESYRPVATNMAKGFDLLKERNDIPWGYISPAANFIADGPRTGSYTPGEEVLLTNSKGESQISYADFAIAMIDEAENGSHIHTRFTVVSE